LGVLLFILVAIDFGFIFDETKSSGPDSVFVPDFFRNLSVMQGVFYAYEIYYVPNSSGSQSNVV